MSASNSRTFIVTLVVSAVALVLWQLTGGDVFTRYEVVEEVTVEIDADDPLAAAGFYDGSPRTEVQTRSEFRFGLLPAADRFPDKLLVSVATTVTPFWMILALVVFYNRRKNASANLSSK